MNIDEKILEQMDRYILNQMDIEEKKVFEKLIESSSEIKEAFEIYQEANTIINDKKGMALEDTLSMLSNKHAESYEQENSNSKKDRKKWLIIIAFLLIIAFCLIYFISRISNQYNHEKLYASYFEPYEVISSTRSSDMDRNKLIDHWSSLYSSNNFESFHELSDSLNVSNDSPIEKSKILFFRGMAYMKSNQEKKAIAFFSRCLDLDKNQYSQQAYWYQSLCYLKEGEINLAKETLIKTKNYSTRGKYHSLADDLLSKI